ncbi:MAG: 4-hydroxybutyrate dehydrogenase [Mobilitalea sp.]
MIQFRIKTTIQIFDRCKEFCEAFQINDKDLIITSGHIYENYLKELSLQATVINLREYGTGEPNDEMVEAIHRDIKEVPYRRVIAMGGGSILDVAKLFVLTNISPVLDLFDRKLDMTKDKELIMVPTTCGTGSEVTNISILELISRKTKLGLASDELFADYAVLIPELLETLPYESFATSSIDAFIHAIESYLSPKANSFTEMYSIKAMEMILEGYLVIAVKGASSRFKIMKNFLLASTYAGIAFGNAGCAAVHALSYPLGSVFHIPHGEANYALLTAVLEKYQSLQPNGKMEKLNQFLSRLLGCKMSSLYDELEDLFQVILPKKALNLYGVMEAQLEEFTESVMKNQGRLMANNYVELSKEAVYEIYRSVY